MSITKLTCEELAAPGAGGLVVAKQGEVIDQVNANTTNKLDNSLTENNVWVGNASNVATEQTTTGVLSGKATLVNGTFTINNAAILATSQVLITATNNGTLTGFLRCTISAGSVVVESQDASNAVIASDNCEFSYLIVI